MRHLVLAAFLLLLSCATSAILPAVQSTWPGVRADVDRGVLDATEDGDLDAAQSVATRLLLDQLGDAIQAGDEGATCAADWPEIRLLAERGVVDQIEDGEIGMGAAASLRERNMRFFEAVQEMCAGGGS